MDDLILLNYTLKLPVCHYQVQYYNHTMFLVGPGLIVTIPLTEIIG